MDQQNVDGSITLDGRVFPTPSEALDYLLRIWGTPDGVCDADTCRTAEMYVGSLISQRS